jgi:hypothetical protein
MILAFVAVCACDDAGAETPAQVVNTIVVATAIVRINDGLVL